MRVPYFFLTLILWGDFTFGQKIRSVEDFYESGKLYSTGYFIEIDSTSETSFGLWTLWYENGQKMSEHLESDIVTRHINYWTEDGRQTLKDGNGEMYEVDNFAADSTIFTIKDSLKNGKFFRYRLVNGGWQLSKEGNFKNGLSNGLTYYYSDHGKIMEITTHLDNKETGRHVEFYDNGNIKLVGEMDNYQRTGIWSVYDFKGRLLKEEKFDSGRKTYAVEYYPNCNKKAEGSFIKIHIEEPKKKPSPENIDNINRKRTSTKRSTYSTVKQGLWIYFASSGKVVKREKYINGILNK